MCTVDITPRHYCTMGYQVHLLQLVFCQLADAFCRHRISCIEGAMHNLQPLQLSTLARQLDLHLRLWDSLSFPNPTWKHVVQNWGKMDLELRVFTETQDSHVNLMNPDVLWFVKFSLLLLLLCCSPTFGTGPSEVPRGAPWRPHHWRLLPAKGHSWEKKKKLTAIVAIVAIGGSQSSHLCIFVLSLVLVPTSLHLFPF